jgi:hypothetical protein
MASGIFELTRNPSGVYLIGQIEWSSESNGTNANTSTVTATLKLQRNALNTTTGTFKGTFTVGGTSETISWYGSLPSKTWVTIKTITVTVNHNSSGAGSCYLYANIKGPVTTTMENTYVSGSTTVDLDQIARQAVMTSATNFSDEENPTITYTNPLGGAIPSLQAGISLTKSSADVIAYHDVDKTAGTDTIELTENERNTLLAAVTQGKSRTVWIYLRTRIGETYFYSPMSKTFTIVDPNPTISPTIKDSNSTTIGLTGNSSKLVRYYSNAQITIGGAAVKQATVESQKVTCGSKSLNGDGTINAIESKNFVFTVTDSRGNTTKKTVTPSSFVEYVKLTCDIANNIPDMDGNMTVRVKGNYFNGSFGSKSNTLTVYYRYKAAGGSYTSWAVMTVTKSGNTYSATADVSGLDSQTNYIFQAQAVDALATVNSAEKPAKATPIFDWGENDFNFNVPVTIMGNFVRAKRCVVGQNANSDTNPWYKFASYTASESNEDIRISFKVTFAYGTATRFATLHAKIRTQNTSGANAINLLEFESDTGIDASNFVLAYSGTAAGAVYELWVKLTAYRFCHFEVLSETSRRDFIDKWVLYNQVSAGYAAAPTSGYTQVTAKKQYLINNFDVGSVVIRYDTTSPASIYGGTWQRIEGRMLYGCASSGTVGATGTHTTGSGTSSLPYVNVAIWRRTE